MSLTTRELQHFSLTRAIAQAASGGLRPGLEREILEQVSTREGRPFAPDRFVVPWEILRRDLAAAGSGGYLVSTQTAEPADVLREGSLVVRVGASVASGLQGPVALPRVTSGVTGQWLSDELDAVTAETPALGQVTLSPKTVAAMATFSRQIGKQSPSLDRFVARHLVGAVGALLDAGALGGIGATGEPLGVVGTSGVETFTGSSLDQAEAQVAVRKVRSNNAEPSAWVAPPATAETLSTRDVGTDTGRFLWENGAMAGVPARATTAAPTATCVLGDWRHLIVGIWGPGIEVLVDPYSNFKDGRTQVRAMLTCDVAVLHPGAFAVGTGVS